LAILLARAWARRQRDERDERRRRGAIAWRVSEDLEGDLRLQGSPNASHCDNCQYWEGNGFPEAPMMHAAVVHSCGTAPGAERPDASGLFCATWSFATALDRARSRGGRLYRLTLDAPDTRVDLDRVGARVDWWWHFVSRCGIYDQAAWGRNSWDRFQELVIDRRRGVLAWEEIGIGAAALLAKFAPSRLLGEIAEHL
jgi:hypothetical protein